MKRLAKAQHSPALAQLASRIAAVARFGAAQGEDPFAKVKSLITDMVAKLEREMGEEARHSTAGYRASTARPHRSLATAQPPLLELCRPKHVSSEPGCAVAVA